MTTVAGVSVRALLSVDYISGLEIPHRILVNSSSSVAKVGYNHVSQTHSGRSPTSALLKIPFWLSDRASASLKDRHTHTFFFPPLSVSV